MKNILTAIVATMLGLGILSAEGEGSSPKEKSGIFIGIDAMGAINYLSSKDEGESLTKNKFEPNVALKAGYQYYFNAYNGLRAYGNFTYGNFTPFVENAETLTLMRYGINLDYLLNFSNDVSPYGFFIGVGYEFLSGEAADGFEEAKKSIVGKGGKAEAKTNGVFMNVGFSKIIENYHRVEFGAKIPFYSYFDITTEDTKGFLRAATILYVSYSYSFSF